MVLRRKRILYLSNSYPQTVSGVTTVVTNLLRWMSPQYELGVICPAQITRYSKKKINGVTHYFLPSYPTLIRKDVRFITPNPLQLQKAFDDFTPNIVHVHDPSPASMVLRDLAVKNNIPVIFSHHFTPQMVLGYLPEGVKTNAQNNQGLNKAILQLACKIYDKANQIIVPTKTVKDSLAGLTSVPISVLSSGLDYSSLQLADPSSIYNFAKSHHLPAHPFALYIGRLDPEKNLEVLLQAWSIVTQKNQAFRLVIAGDGGSAAKLKSLARDLGISRQITWTGHIPPQELPLLYRQPLARVFVIPSPIESQSIVTLMALGSALPVVAADAGALPEIVINGQTGYLCPPDNSRAFAAKLLHLLNNPAQAELMGQNGSKIAKKHDYPQVIKKYRNLYEKTLLLGHHSHP